MESLLVDPRLDEIFNENKKSDGSLGCVLFTLSTLLPPRNDRENAEKKTYEDNDTSSSTTAGTAGAAGTASPPPTTTPPPTTITNDSPTMGGRRDSGELVVLDSKVCYFDVGYRGVVSTLRRGQVHRLLRKPRRLLRLHNLQTLLQRDEVGFQSYTGVHQGWVSIRLEAEKDVRSELIALRVAVIDSGRLSLDFFRKSIDRER